MAAREGSWLTGDREKRQRISQELSQLKQMSTMLRTKSMRAFQERIAAQRPEVKRAAPPAKPASTPVAA
ncbi:MAG TPA: hypothetical protein VLA02_06995 [Reyranella sp.]|nr:hypothetical protein [Reyranella sp.]